MIIFISREMLDSICFIRKVNVSLHQTGCPPLLVLIFWCPHLLLCMYDIIYILIISSITLALLHLNVHKIYNIDKTPITCNIISLDFFIPVKLWHLKKQNTSFYIVNCKYISEHVGPNIFHFPRYFNGDWTDR